MKPLVTNVGPLSSDAPAPTHPQHPYCAIPERRRAESLWKAWTREDHICEKRVANVVADTPFNIISDARGLTQIPQAYAGCGNARTAPAPTNTGLDFNDHGRSQSATLLTFPPMFKKGSRSMSPGRTASALYATTNGIAQTKGINLNSPASMAIPEQRPFSPWGSTDSQSSTSPKTTSTRAQRATTMFSKQPKRPVSPTSVMSVRTGTSAMTKSKSARSFLGRRKPQIQQEKEDEFDPTTFRKNRTRPSLGARGQDALYQEYDDLFNDDVDAEDSMNDADLSHTSDTNDEEEGFLLLQITDKPLQKRADIQLSPHLSPKTARRPSDTPRSVPAPPPPLQPLNGATAASQTNGKLSPPPPSPPPKSWRRSVVNPTPTPPRSSAPSIDVSADEAAVEPATISAPPTPPPKAPTPTVPVLTVETNLGRRRSTNDKRSTSTTAPVGPSNGPPPTRPPPPTPGSMRNTRRRYSKRASTLSQKRPRSIPDGLGIINIPSPTLFCTEFSPDGWSGEPLGSDDQAAKSTALTTGSPSFTTPRQGAHGSPHQGNSSLLSGIARQFDEVDGVESDPGEGADIEPLRLRKGLGVKMLESKTRNDFPGMKTKMELSSDDEAKKSSTGSAVQTMLDSMLTASEAETDATDNELTPSAAAIAAGSMMGDTVQMVKAKVVASMVEEREVKVTADGESGTDGDSPTKQTEQKVMVDELSDRKESAKEDDANNEEGKPDTAHLRVFRAFIKSSGDNDPFTQRMPRFDAIQAQRICVKIGDKVPLGVTSPKRRASTKIRRRDSKLRQREAAEEIMTSLWALMAARWMNRGRIILSPAHDSLVAANHKRLSSKSKRHTARPRETQLLSSAAETSEDPDATDAQPEKERRRVLDLGGLAVADWGWHCAMDYPKVKVYTVTQRPGRGRQNSSPKTPKTPTSADEPLQSPTNPHFRGPKNHRHLSVDRLYRLPFPSAHFDVVSARTLFLTLRASTPSKASGQLLDEYDRCLDECMRVLKPGGYLEFTLFDNEIINPGPQAKEVTKKFSQELRSKGYDPEPTRRWISRLNKAGFTDIRRAWMFLPMAPPTEKPKVPSKSDGAITANEANGQDLDKVKEEVRRKMQAWEESGAPKGTTGNIAPVTGLIAGWSWEKWLAAVALGNDGEVGSVLDEGKEQNSGWRGILGHARKPETTT